MHGPPNQPVITSEMLAEKGKKHQPVSYNLIVKGSPQAVRKCVDSIYGALFVRGCKDECVIVDTGSTNSAFKKIKQLEKLFPNLRVIDRRDIAVNYLPLVEKYLHPDVLEAYIEHIGDPRGILDFSAARQIAQDASKNDLIFWIDSDDVLMEEKQGELRRAINFIFTHTPMTQIFMDYDYEFGHDGVCTTVLRRERIFKKDIFHWVGRCHETAIPRPGKDSGSMAFLECVHSKIVHTDARKPHKVSDVRNYIILRDEFEETKAANCLDPRTVFYLGNSARGLELFSEAESYYKFFDFHSGSIEDRYAAHYYRAQMYMDPRVKRPFDALDHFFKCVEIKPFDPRGYFGLSRAYGSLARWMEVVHWYKMGLGVEIPKDQMFSHDPTHIHYHPHVIAAYAYKEMYRGEEAMECAERAYRFRPNSEEAQEMWKRFRMNLYGVEIHKAVNNITNNIRYPGGLDSKRVAVQICEELTAIPESLERNGVSKLEPPEGREEAPSVAIMCGPSGEPWGPFCRQDGTGGSEKMVIILADALQRKGVNVTVYGEVPVPVRGVSAETGVDWRHWAEFDPKRQRDVVVFWRDPDGAMKVRCPARLRMLWNHDVQDASRYTKDVLEMLDYIQFQSEFHLDSVKDVVPAEKVWVARNAIEVKDASEAPTRNAKRVLFCSSPDRGLTTAVEVVRRARLVDPEITLVVTYGVTPWARKMFAQQTHRFVPDLGRDVSMDEYERFFRNRIDGVDGVVLNRIGFEQMRGLMQSSGVWIYPTRFPEISCMSAMEAQANGMVVLSTRYGALKETISVGAFPALPDLPEAGGISNEWFDEAAEMLAKAVNVPAESPIRDAHARIAQERFDVEALADDWITKLGLGAATAVPPLAQEALVPPAEPISKEIP
jgi:glycosyltransferase involved in cell wall biosynthesis